MNTFAVQRESLDGDAWVGAMLARDLRDAAGQIVLRKGTLLQRTDRVRLANTTWSELHLVRADAGDVHEGEAGLRLASLAAGTGCRARGRSGAEPGDGHWPITAAWRGILRVHVEPLARVNAIDGLAVYTLYDGQVVDDGEPVARAKIVPFAVPRDALECAASLAGAGLVEVRPFVPQRIGAVVSESLGSGAAERFRTALEEKSGWLGSTLLDPAFVAATPEGLADGLAAVRRGRADVIVVAGSRPKDPLDPAFVALERLGASVERRGVPAHPGSLAWLARWDGVPVIGMPSCGLFSRATVFDLMLPRLLAGERLDAADLAALGHGGFLTRDMAFRFPPYRPARDRGEIA